MEYLNIESKEDTSQKLVAAAGKPTKNFLFSNELNQIVNSINTLRHLITLDSGNIASILNQANVIPLEAITEPFLTVLNNLESTEMVAPVFVTYSIEGIDYASVFIGNNDTYGTNYGLFLSESDFILLYENDPSSAMPVKKEFLGKLTQSGTSSPSCSVSFNQLDFYPTISKDINPGHFHMLIPGVTEPNKVHVFFGPASWNDNNEGKILYSINGGGIDPVFLSFVTYNSNTYETQDGYLFNTSIHIVITE